MTIIVDASNFVHRMANNIDNPTKFNAVHPIREFWMNYSQPTDLTIFVWDGYNGNARRKAVYPEYKGNRGEKGEDIYAAFELVKELLAYTPCMQINVPEWEADDVVFTLAKFFSTSGDEVKIITNDADYLQMEDIPGIMLPGITKFAYGGSLICTYKALVGDPADNIPGMPRFGDGAFKNLTLYHETLREALKNKDWDLWQTIPFPKLNEKACLDRGNFDRVCLFYQVVTMQDVPVDEIAMRSTTGVYQPRVAELLLDKYML